MTSFGMWVGGALAIVIGAAAVHAPARAQATAAARDRAKILLTTALPALEGSHLRVTLVEVGYGPGESSPVHSHSCPVIGYVVEGSLRTRVQGESERIYTAGQTFYEASNGVHLVSANASQTAPARFVAYFVCDHAAPLSGPPPNSAPPASAPLGSAAPNQVSPRGAALSAPPQAANRKGN